jgi:hypothetical protein
MSANRILLSPGKDSCWIVTLGCDRLRPRSPLPAFGITNSFPAAFGGVGVLPKRLKRDYVMLALLVGCALYLHHCSDRYWVERTGSRVGIAPTLDQTPSRAHADHPASSVASYTAKRPINLQRSIMMS